MDIGSTLAFIGVATAIAISPGQTNMLVLSKGLSGKLQSVISVLLGVFLGNMAWILLCVIGIASLIHSSLVAFQILKVVGAVYLIYLGIRTFLDAKKEAELSTSPDSRRGLCQGMISSLSNPKGFVFYVAFIPQFVSGNDNVTYELLFWGMLYLSIFLPISLLYGLFGMKVFSILRSSRVVMKIKQTTGIVLSSMGISLLSYREV